MNNHHATVTSVGDAVIDSTLAGNDGYIRAESRPATQNNAAAAAAAAVGIKRTQSGKSGGGGGSSSGSIRNLLLPTPVAPFGGRNAGWDQKPSAAAAAAAITKTGRPLTSPKPKAVLNHQGPHGTNCLPQSALQPYNTAIFYSECHLAGISPENAERAVESASEQYQRWWVEALRRKSSNGGVLPGDVGRLSSSGALDDSSEDGTADGSRYLVSSRSQRRPNSKKLRKSQSNSSGGSDYKAIRAHRSHRAAMREVIDRVAKRQAEQGGGYLSPVTAPNYASDYSSSVPSCHGGLKATNGFSHNSDRAEDAAALVSSASTSVTPTTDESSGAEEVAAHTCNHATKGDAIVSGRESLGALSISPKVPEQARRQAMEAKSALLSSLASTGGDVTHPSFITPLAVLEKYYKLIGVDARAGVLSPSRKSPFGSTIGLTGAYDSGSGIGNDRHSGSSAATVEGTWLSLSRPDYTHCLGKNDKQHYVYTLGRLSFDMFRPTGLRCSIQGEFNTVNILEGDDILPEHVPRKLQKEVLRCKHSGGRLLTYNIVVAFVIEPNQDRHGNQIGEVRDTDGANTDKNKRHHPRHRHRPITRPIRGIMTNLGFMLPDPKTPNRMSVWFTEGQLEVNDEEEDLKEWQRIFDNRGAPKRALRERAHMLAAKLFLGADVPDQMDEDGTKRYELKRPIGGHGLAFTDVLYLDDDLRILRGHHGQIYVCARVLTGESAAALQAVARNTTQDRSSAGDTDGHRQQSGNELGSAFQVSA